LLVVVQQNMKNLLELLRDLVGGSVVLPKRLFIAS
jgi:hypothetical protein